MLSDNLVDSARFARELSSALRLPRPELRRPRFVLAVVAALRTFAEEKGHPLLTSPKAGGRGGQPKNALGEGAAGGEEARVISESSFNLVKNTFNEYIRPQ